MHIYDNFLVGITNHEHTITHTTHDSFDCRAYVQTTDQQQQSNRDAVRSLFSFLNRNSHLKVRIATAKYAFTHSRNSCEFIPETKRLLNLHIGSVYLIFGEICDDGYYRACNTAGVYGLIPSNYIEIMDEILDDDAEKWISSQISLNSSLSVQTDFSLLNTSKHIKVAPAPVLQQVEYCSSGSKIKWLPPPLYDEFSIDGYQIFVDGKLYCTKQSTDVYEILVNGKNSQRVSVCLVGKDGISNWKLCTAKINTDSLAPDCLTIKYHDDSTVNLSWIPAHSSIKHVLKINGRSVRYLAANTYKIRIKGLPLKSSCTFDVCPIPTIPEQSPFIKSSSIYFNNDLSGENFAIQKHPKSVDSSIDHEHITEVPVKVEVPTQTDNQLSEIVASSDRISTDQNNNKDEVKLYIALYDYEPTTMSPNVDTCNEELGFYAGQILKIHGQQDQDGFFIGELSGSLGYVPSNMISELSMKDPELFIRLVNQNIKADKHQVIGTGEIETDKTQVSQGIILKRASQNVQSSSISSIPMTSRSSLLTTDSANRTSLNSSTLSGSNRRASSTKETDTNGFLERIKAKLIGGVN
ncbi:hypothetical protein GJ496_005848 [Pomphorhynchus laevis]|nr:hypothetical protein GJ496_005848 [Pomphorhynchus laevis]